MTSRPSDVSDGIEIPRVRAGSIEMSRVAYGTWRMADDPDRDSAARYRRKIDALIDAGVTTFDLADLYGDYQNERRFGASVTADRALRQRIQIVTKCGIKQPGAAHPGYRVRHFDAGYRHVVASAEASLKHLSTDYLDLLLIHRPDLLTAADETARALDDLVAAGKVRAVGVSNCTASQVALLQSRLSSPLSVHQLEVSVAAPQALLDGRLDQCQQERICPMVYSPLGGRVIFGEAADDATLMTMREVATRLGVGLDVLALAWVLALPTSPLIVLGSHRLDRLLAQITALHAPLDRQDWYAIWRAATT
jgi:predicted oxidoreductase